MELKHAHPDTLTITARNKMRSADESKVKTDYSNRWYETFFMDARLETHTKNLKLFEDFLNANIKDVDIIESESGSRNRPMFYWFKDVPFDIAYPLIANFEKSKSNSWVLHSEWNQYIMNRSRLEYKFWDVAFLLVRLRMTLH